MQKATTGAPARAARFGPAVDSSFNDRRARDALELLIEDHRVVERLFDTIAGLDDDDALLARVDRLCDALELHAALEEEIVYPLFRGAIGEAAFVVEAEIEHEHVKALVAELRMLSPDDERFRPTLHVLEVYVQHHVAEEEEEMFPAARACGIDMEALGEELVARRQELAPADAQGVEDARADDGRKGDA